jgi:hypothetical protein
MEQLYHVYLFCPQATFLQRPGNLMTWNWHPPDRSIALMQCLKDSNPPKIWHIKFAGVYTIALSNVYTQAPTHSHRLPTLTHTPENAPIQRQSVCVSLWLAHPPPHAAFDPEPRQWQTLCHLACPLLEENNRPRRSRIEWNEGIHNSSLVDAMKSGF